MGIDWDPALSLVALDAQGTGLLLKSNEHKMMTWQEEADLVVRTKRYTHDSSASRTGPHDPDRKGRRSTDYAGLGVSGTRWTGMT